MHDYSNPAGSAPARGALHRIDPTDNVAVALRQLEPGEVVSSGDSGDLSRDRLPIRELIPRGHKVAVSRIAAGNAVLKYGWPIGQARCDIEPGSLVHSDNLTTQLTGLNQYEYQLAAPLDSPLACPCMISSSARHGSRQTKRR